MIHCDGPRPGVVTFSGVTLKVLLVVLSAIQLVLGVLVVTVCLNMNRDVSLISVS